MGQQTVEFQAINYYWTLGNLNRDLDFNARSMGIDLFGLFDILLEKIRYQCFDDVFHCDNLVYFKFSKTIKRNIGISKSRIYCIDRYIV